MDSIAYITNISVLFLDKSFMKTADKLPDNYKLLSNTLNNKKADLNKGSGGRDIYLSYNNDRQKKPITDLKIIVNKNGRSYDKTVKCDGYEIIQYTPAGNVADLNKDSGGKDIYLAYKRGDGVPITDLGVLSFNDKDFYIDKYNDWNIIPSNLNEGSGGNTIFLCYKKNLEYELYSKVGLRKLCDKYMVNYNLRHTREQLINLLSK